MSNFNQQECSLVHFVVGGFIDGSGAAMLRNVAISVHGGIITAITPAAEFSGGGEAFVDLSHCVILPAMVDCSVTLSRSSSVDSKVRLSAAKGRPEEKATLRKRHIRDCHVHGVLGVAVGDDLADFTREDGAIIEFRNSGCDFIRIAYSNDIEDMDSPSAILQREGIQRLLAQRGGERKAVVVANGRQAAEEALAAGCDVIEQGYEMGEDNLRVMADRGVLWIPGALRARNALDGSRSGGEVCCRFSTRYVAPGQPRPGAEAYWEKMLAGQLAQLRRAKELGVKTATGTGAGSPGILHGEAMAEEIKLFLKAGYSVEEAICCASENGAKFFGMEKLGRLKVGKPATFLVVRGTAPQLPRKLSYLEAIYVDGAPSAMYRKNPGYKSP